MSANSVGVGPLVSVIIPTYNYAHFIGQTLDSLLAQTYARWECLVVDDDSTDDTPAVVAGYAERDARIRYLHQPNALQAAAKNLGMRHAAGDYLQFLDADDLIEPRKLEHQVEYLARHPEVDIVYGDVNYFVEDPRETFRPEGTPTGGVSGSGREVLEPLLRDNITVINAPLVRRRAADRAGPFDIGLPPAEDWDFWLRCALAGARFQFDAAPGTLALVRTHSLSSSRNHARMFRSILLMRRKVGPLLADPALRRLNREQLAVNEGQLGAAEAAAGRKARGLAHLLRAAWGERRLNRRAKWLWCALCLPFVSGEGLRELVATPARETLASFFGRRSRSHH
jgi:glycosyltransferase involved in cell wall biosynthesis